MGVQERANKRQRQDLESKAKVFDNLIKILNEDSGITASNFNSCINLAKANIQGYVCSHAIIEAMERKQELYQKLYSIIQEHYK